MDLFIESWSWQFDKPDWWAEMNRIWYESREEYLENKYLSSQVDVGIFIEDKFIGLIILEEFEPSILNVHIDSPRQTNLEYLIEAAKITRDHCFENGITYIFTHTASFNKPIHKIHKEVGFIDTGMRIIKGTVRGRVVEWLQFCLVNKLLVE